MGTVPRERFVPPRLRSRAYEDTPLPVGPEATLSAPDMVAAQLQSAQVFPGARVLELGSGSGYVLALLALLVGPEGTVVGVEIEPSLVESSREVLRSLALPTEPKVLLGHGDEPGTGASRFDRLLVSYAQRLPLPPAWEAVVVPGGTLVLPLTERDGTFLTTFRRSAGGWGDRRRGLPCLFVTRKDPPPRRI
jgi:protein-L-isoaspartate(D-aspartate) O-methyltransferase